MIGVISECYHPTMEMVNNLIKIELSYINTNHPDFLNVNELNFNQNDFDSMETGAEEGNLGGKPTNKKNLKNEINFFSQKEIIEINIVKHLIY